MNKILIALAFLFAINVNTTFAQDKVETEKVPQNIMTAFKAKYPNAEGESWTKDIKKNYTVKFKIGKKKCTSAYNKEAKWNGASIGLTFEELPAPVKEAFQKSTYATWKIQDVLMAESDSETVYTIIAKEKKEQKFLTYKPDGQLK